MRTYAIADLHGRLDLLEAAYDRLPAEPGRIVHLGDYIDRGPDSRGVVEFLMNDDTIPEGYSRVILKGNHEAVMVETIRKSLDPAWWCSAANGGDRTLISYGHPKMRRAWPYNPGVIPEEHLDFLDGLPLFFADNHRVFVHAMAKEDASLPEQKEEVVLWGTYSDDYQGGYRGAHLVHGHHEHKEALLLAGRTCLDVGAWRSDRLVVGVFDSDVAGGPVSLMEVSA